MRYRGLSIHLSNKHSTGWKIAYTRNPILAITFIGNIPQIECEQLGYTTANIQTKLQVFKSVDSCGFEITNIAQPVNKEMTMHYIVATRRGRLNVRHGPGLNYRVYYKLNKGAVVQVKKKHNGWCRLFIGGWASEQYLRPHEAPHIPRTQPPPIETPLVSRREIFFAEEKLKSYIRWHNPPRMEGGVGGVYPGESDYGRLKYPYFNWLTAYLLTVEAYLIGEPQSRATQEWAGYMRRQGLLPDHGNNGVQKASHVWNLIPIRVREVMVDDYHDTGDICYRVMTYLRNYRRSEIRRFYTPRDYRILSDMLGV